MVVQLQLQVMGWEGPPSSLPPTHRLISHIATFIQFSTHRPLSYSNRDTSTRGKILRFFLRRKVGGGQGPTGSRYPTRPELFFKYPTRPDPTIENDWVLGNQISF